MEFDKEIVRLYNLYLKKIPLDLIGKHDSEIGGWKNNVQLSLFDFSRIISIIHRCNNLRGITQSGYDLDFDNLEPIFSLLICEGSIAFTENNSYEIINLPAPNKMRKIKEDSFIDNPDDKLNQFPCSIGSRILRVKKIVNDFPYTTSMRIGLMGDDDLVSLEIARRTNFTPIVFELDKKIIEKITQVNKGECLGIEIIEKDFRDLSPNTCQVDTFFADPPYTVGGVLTFLYAGLKLLSSKDRVYLIANQMFLGKRGMPEIFKSLSDAGIFPVEISNAFNEYPLPSNYRESQDLSNKLKTLGNIDVSKLMSSSSSLFVLMTNDLNLKSLKNKISKMENIYDRYGRYSND
jgi:hypothetical protein